MSLSWFRMYSEIANDPKVLVLTEALRWRYVALLCIHCDEKLINRPDDEIALSLRVTVDEWISTKEIFIKRGLINETNEPLGWQKRQHLSDIKDPTASERQKRYRDKKRNAPVTSRLPDSDTDTDTDKKKKVSESAREGFSEKSLLVNFSLAEAPEWIEWAVKERAWQEEVAVDVWQSFREYYTAGDGKKTKREDWFLSWKTWVRRENIKPSGGLNGNHGKKSQIDLIAKGIADARAQRERLASAKT